VQRVSLLLYTAHLSLPFSLVVVCIPCSDSPSIETNPHYRQKTHILPHSRPCRECSDASWEQGANQSVLVNNLPKDERREL